MCLPDTTPASTLVLNQGSARNFVEQAYYAPNPATGIALPAVNVFLNTDTLHAYLWSGDGTVTLATPSVTWYLSNAPSGQYQISFTNSDTAAIAAGSYFLQVTFTRAGQTGTIGWFGFDIVSSPGTGSTANPLDLVTFAQAQDFLGCSLPGDLSILPTIITGVSRAVQRYCRRWFILQSYVEITQPCSGQWDKSDPNMILLKQFPIVGNVYLAGGITNALQIQNVNTTTVQQAYVGFTTSGDPDISLTNTGLQLVSVTSGVQATQTVPWTVASPFTTIQAVANAINALGNGWQATLQAPSLGAWGAYTLYGSGSFSNATSPGQCMLSIFQYPIPSNVEADTGTIWMTAGSGYGGYGYGTGNCGDWMFGYGGDGSNGSNYNAPCLALYSAGYAVTPADIVEAVMICIKTFINELQVNTMFEENKVDTILKKLSGMPERVIPQSAKKLLAPWRIHSVRA